MSKSALAVMVEELARKNGLGQHAAETFVKTMFEVINHGLDEDKQVKVRGLGTFKVTSVKDRESVDVNTGERILLEGHDKINFTPEAVLRDLVNKPFAQFETVILNDGVDFSEIDRKFEVAEEAAAEEAEEAPLLDFESPVPPAAEDAPEEKPGSAPETPEPEALASPEQPVTGEDPAAERPEPAAEDAGQAEDVETVEVTLPLEEPVAVGSPVAAPEPASEAGRPEDGSAPAPDEPEDSAESREPAAEPAGKEPNVYKYIALIVSATSFVLLVCLGVLAYQYHKVVVQRNQLLMSLSEYKSVQAAEEPAADKVAEQARMDSLRMEQAAKAVETAEAAKQKEDRRLAGGEVAPKPEVKEKSAAAEKAKAQDITAGREKPAAARAAEKKQPAAEKTQVAEKQQPTAEKQPAAAASRYDSDPRVRTGAYRIVGVAQTVTVKPGQTLSSISRAYLGPGMECYVEALNGTAAVKEGQKLKIPKLELRRKR